MMTRRADAGQLDGPTAQAHSSRMKKSSALVAMSLALGTTLALTATASANPRFHARGTAAHFSGGHAVVQRHGAHGQAFARGRGFGPGHAAAHGQGFAHGRAFPHGHGFAPGHGFRQHPFFPHRFVPFAFVAPPLFAYSSPSIFDPSYYPADPPAAYAPPAYSQPVYAPPAYSEPAPMPRVVEYSTGRYELRGDGVTTAYTWVWIPNPPPAPPAPPSAPPAAAPPASMTPAPESPPVRRTTVYRWVDEQGIVHLTDRLDTVPERYQRDAKSPKIF